MLKNTKTQSGKLDANFESEPYTVRCKNGSEVTEKSKNGVEYRRNSSFVKRYNIPGEAKELTQDANPETVGAALGSGLLEDSAVASRPKRTTRMPEK